jgi:hypothetical protein
VRLTKPEPVTIPSNSVGVTKWFALDSSGCHVYREDPLRNSRTAVLALLMKKFQRRSIRNKIFSIDLEPRRQRPFGFAGESVVFALLPHRLPTMREILGTPLVGVNRTSCELTKNPGPLGGAAAQHYRTLHENPRFALTNQSRCRTHNHHLKEADIGT